MKITITGFNPFGAIETKDYEVDDTGQFSTDLMPISVIIKDKKKTMIRFDYETDHSEDLSELEDLG